MTSGFFLDGSMIERRQARSIDERSKSRAMAESSTAVLEFRGTGMSDALEICRNRGQ